MMFNPIEQMPALLLMTLFLSLALTAFFTWYTRHAGMFDVPENRHSHILPTPRGGGAGLVISVIVVSGPFLTISHPFSDYLLGLLPGLIALALVGWWDDRVSLSARFRFVVQLLASLLLLTCLRSQLEQSHVLMLSLAGLFLLWSINLYNFMDGSNGMAGTQGVFTGLVLACLFLEGGDEFAALWSALIAIACIGFLPWNLGKTRVFMGDVASGVLGFVFGALLIYGVFSDLIAIPVAWMVMLVFICDSTLTLIVRVIRGEQWYNPHKQHLYQRLIALGWSHGKVLAIYQLVNFLWVLPAIAVAVKFPDTAWFMGIAITLGLGLGWILAIKRIGVLA